MVEPLEQQHGIAPLQRQFATALMRPEHEPPAAIAGGTKVQRLKRFNVYRNNVHSSLAKALAARFPVIERLVGDEFFRAMALVFIDRHPPSSPVLAEYGAHFPAFIDRFEPVEELPYLPDVARLEWLRNVAYYAADAEPAPISALAALPSEDLTHVRLVLHPATGCVASDYPIVSIWRTNTHDETVRPIGPEAAGEVALVTRPALYVLVTALPPGGAVFVSELQRGASLGAAAHCAMEQAPLLNLSELLAILYGSGAIANAETWTQPLRGPS